MGQKVHPKSFRLGVNKTWSSRWFARSKDYADVLHRDLTLRRALGERLKDSGVAKIEIERSTGSVKVHIHTAKPGIIIGRQGAAIEQLRQDLASRFNEKIEINIIEVAKPDSDAQLIADNIAGQIERRIAYRRAARQGMSRSMEGQNGLKGIKIRVAGRLNGAEISREETFKEGNIPLHTIRADIDYAQARARTTYGIIGVKVWLYKGEIFDNVAAQQDNQNWLSQSRKAPANDNAAGRLEEELAA